jgi:hypothetical protein
VSKKRDKIRAHIKAAWERESPEQVAKARAKIGIEPDALVPDEDLITEAAHYLPRSNPTGSQHLMIESHEQWAGWRLIGAADTPEGRERLAEKIRRHYAVDPNRSGKSSGPPRRSAKSGRERHKKPRS